MGRTPNRRHRPITVRYVGGTTRRDKTSNPEMCTISEPPDWSGIGSFQGQTDAVDAVKAAILAGFSRRVIKKRVGRRVLQLRILLQILTVVTAYSSTPSHPSGVVLFASFGPCCLSRLY